MDKMNKIICDNCQKKEAEYIEKIENTFLCYDCKVIHIDVEIMDTVKCYYCDYKSVTLYETRDNEIVCEDCIDEALRIEML